MSQAFLVQDFHGGDVPEPKFPSSLTVATVLPSGA